MPVPVQLGEVPHTTKGAVKLHVKLNHAGYLPNFMAVTTGNVHECQ